MTIFRRAAGIVLNLGPNPAVQFVQLGFISLSAFGVGSGVGLVRLAEAVADLVDIRLDEIRVEPDVRVLPLGMAEAAVAVTGRADGGEPFREFDDWDLRLLDAPDRLVPPFLQAQRR